MSRSSRSKSFKVAGLFILALLILLLIIRPWSRRTPLPITGQLAVEDGDTFLRPDGQEVRLLAIDAPEVQQPLFAEATEYLSELLQNGELSYRFGPRRYDRYGRLLALVYVDTILVNLRMLEAGLAYAYFFPDDFVAQALLDSLCQAQKRARIADRGIWSEEPPMPEDYYYGNPRSYRFHRPDCPNIRNADKSSYLRLSSRGEALDRCYSPCRNCRP